MIKVRLENDRVIRVRKYETVPSDQEGISVTVEFQYGGETRRASKIFGVDGACDPYLVDDYADRRKAMYGL